MVVKRIVPNIATASTAAATAFYADVLGMKIGMDHGWIVTFTSEEAHPRRSASLRKAVQERRFRISRSRSTISTAFID